MRWRRSRRCAGSCPSVQAARTSATTRAIGRRSSSMSSPAATPASPTASVRAVSSGSTRIWVRNGRSERSVERVPASGLLLLRLRFGLTLGDFLGDSYWIVVLGGQTGLHFGGVGASLFGALLQHVVERRYRVLVIHVAAFASGQRETESGCE